MPIFETDKSGFMWDATAVPNAFFCEYMPIAPESHVMVYLYGLMWVHSGLLTDEDDPLEEIARTFHLEHTGGAPLCDHIKGLLIVLGNILQPEIGLGTAHHLQSIIQNGEVSKAEEIHLKKTEFVKGGHGVLCDDRLIVCGKRNVFRNGTVGYNDTGRMG